MGYMKYLKQTKNTEEAKKLAKERLISFRTEPALHRISNPTKPDRARALGYRAKQGIFIVRQRVIRGGHTRPMIKHGRRPKHNRQRMVLAKGYKQIAEERVSREYKNCEILNSYYVTRDGRNVWYEVIVVDANHPSIKADASLKWLANHKGRAFRGVTAAGKKSRGILTHKGKGVEKNRPSLRAKGRRGN
ncbi:50S ribosomal protein L15e [Candidatus Woesearchaeota archaeon]|nr:50S ribosomal protein L15e [Candidatus Woesearchaeota archaeon]